MKHESVNSWYENFAGAVTICNKEGVILYMNNKSLELFKDDGGIALLGTNVPDCHPEPSKTKVKNMLKDQAENIYTVEKDGQKKLIYQGPWFREGEYSGIVELSIELPEQMKHFVR